MLAPYARIGQPSLPKGVFGRMQHAYAALPSRFWWRLVVFACIFSFLQHIVDCWWYFQGVMYGAVGLACGIIGQGIANLIMTANSKEWIEASFGLGYACTIVKNFIHESGYLQQLEKVKMGCGIAAKITTTTKKK
ncbi:hypothetical protein RHGRI_029084 [Rhododendron griersonianum]|uniref:Uncharacterized protein n=1 Tax=Rhododendron griersonianum TaxID=479676 RepID=A0AAV6II89_9ERIC|nr:hypothetical protein RHGRI_029084 [Rhododendron griersonianum]